MANSTVGRSSFDSENCCRTKQSLKDFEGSDITSTASTQYQMQQPDCGIGVMTANRYLHVESKSSLLFNGTGTKMLEIESNGFHKSYRATEARYPEKAADYEKIVNMKNYLINSTESFYIKFKSKMKSSPKITVVRKIVKDLPNKIRPVSLNYTNLTENEDHSISSKGTEEADEMRLDGIDNMGFWDDDENVIFDKQFMKSENKIFRK